MKRLADLILQKGLRPSDDLVVPKGYASAANACQSLVNHLLEVPVIVADNVADYVQSKVDSNKTWRLTNPADFPNIASPWPSAFIESRRPTGVPFHTPGAKYLSPRLWGAFVDCIENPNRDEPIRWLLSLIAVAIGNDDQPILSDCRTEIEVGPVGQALKVRTTVSNGQPRGLEWAVTPLMAICFAHCQNVKVTRQAPDKHLSHVHKKRTGRPLVRYHVLDIEPMKRVLEIEGGASKTGIKMALHICRGHFARYGPEFGTGKLFGKYEGTFWMPQHVRGSAKHGVVVKDYNVKAPP